MKKKSFLLSALAISLGLTFASVPVANASIPVAVDGQALPSLAPMLEKVLPAVVSVQVTGTTPASSDVPPEFKFFFGPQAPTEDQGGQAFEGLGSGVIIDAAKGYVLTNNHVVNNADKIKVQINDGREYDAKLIGKDDQSDIALIQLIDAKNLTQIAMADSDALRVGDFAVAVGNPFGLGQTATSGIISALGRSGLNLEGLENFIQTDASINRGNSGGALINLKGELIGINTAILSSQGGSIGIGFAIPVNMAKNLSAQLIKFGEVKRGLLGIRGSEMTPELAKAFKLDSQRGAFVNEVLPDSAAAKAGIKAGDVLITLQGKPLSSFAELRAKVGTAGPGVTMQIGLLREGKPMNVDVTLDKSPTVETSIDKINPALQGVTLSDLDPKTAKGIRVDDVKKGSPADQIGLQKDDVIIGVNREAVDNLAALRKILETKPALIALSVQRKGQNIYLLMP
ncbi:serine endoprotease DegQ [Ewingella americana]|uniref:peptidase Do n=2 Tax=Ewingella americana TaxID=41202 RepID=A0A085GPG9_EWIA3|nr:serine endoprotease DegQ [Ewingella americana]KAA8728204.1 Do family serine endopeptidase [Ewingella americana]KFC85614.1 outer membrane stress sensor serine protease [Ewingella americana ATCC 33852]STQ46513.1 Periplasmic pH-dependent serine endoprotease DegQ precursor [Ewingella americana]